MLVISTKFYPELTGQLKIYILQIMMTNGLSIFTVRRDHCQGEAVQNIPLHLSYKTPDTVCFTRTSNDLLQTQRVLDWIAFNRSIFEHKETTLLEVNISAREFPLRMVFN